MLEQEELYCNFKEVMRKDERNDSFSILSYNNLLNILNEEE